MLFCAGASLFHLSTIVGFGATVVAMPLLSTIVSIYWPRALPGSFASFLLRASQFGPQTGILIALMALMSFGVFWLATTAHLRPRPVHFVVFSVVFSLGLLAGIGVNYKMKGYQRGRFAAYVAPQADIQGAAYHVRQSQIAIGSGGLFGKGLFSGTQSQLGFLPERHTDFIYAVIGEEMGFFGALLILGLYLFLIWRIVRTGELARDRYGYLVCAGLATMFGFELVLNAGMCLGILPVAGVPLPMISYGGSSLMISLWSLGIVSNIYARRYALL
jgi:rod shape determining protein RodA